MNKFLTGWLMTVKGAVLLFKNVTSHWEVVLKIDCCRIKLDKFECFSDHLLIWSVILAYTGNMSLYSIWSNSNC